MTKTSSENLSGVPETLLIALYMSAMELQRPGALMKDENTEALVAQMSYDLGALRAFG